MELRRLRYFVAARGGSLTAAVERQPLYGVVSRVVVAKLAELGELLRARDEELGTHACFLAVFAAPQSEPGLTRSG